MINKELVDYIKNNIEQGKGIDQIKDELISGGGWQKGDVVEAMSHIQSGQASNVPQRPTQSKKKSGWKLILGVLITLVFLVGIYFFTQGKGVVIDNGPIPNPTPSEPKQDKGIPNDVVSRIDELLVEHNIRLPYLLSAEGGELNSFSYQSTPTGYDFVLTDRSTIEENVGFDSTTMVRAYYDIYYNDLRIFTKAFMLTFSERDGGVRAHRLELTPILLSSTPSISKAQAKILAVKERPAVATAKGVLGYYDKNLGGSNSDSDYILAWLFDAGGPIVRLDANTGEVLYSWSGIFDEGGWGI